MHLQEKSIRGVSVDNDYEPDPNSDDEIEREEYFKSTEAIATCYLEDVLFCLKPSFQTELSTPPSAFTMSTFLDSLIDENTDSYNEAINAAARYAIDNLETFELLGSVLWCTFYYLSSIWKVILRLSASQAKILHSRIHKLFLSEEYPTDLKTAFGVKELNVEQRTVGAQLSSLSNSNM